MWDVERARRGEGGSEVEEQTVTIPKAALSEQPTLPTSPLHSQELPTTEKKSTRQPHQPITPSAPLTRCLRRMSGVEITLSLALFIEERPSLGGKQTESQWEESHVRPCGSPERGTLCYFTSIRTQFFCFLQSHLLVLQGPVTTLTELPWSESQHNRKTSPRPMPSSPPCYIDCLCALCTYVSKLQEYM